VIQTAPMVLGSNDIFYSQLHVNGIEQQAMPIQAFYIILYYIN
jgi:hypothetical protein